jgi:hypothetical protein
MARVWRCAPLAIGVILFCLCFSSSSAREQAPSQALTITLDPIPEAVVGDRPVIVAHLNTAEEEPVSGVLMYLYSCTCTLTIMPRTRPVQPRTEPQS